MAFQTIISVEHLAKYLSSSDWLVFDTRFNLMNAQWGREQYHFGHIPGASYVHLNEELSGPVIPDVTGRHPLPIFENFADRVAQWGISRQHQIVIYDQCEGMFAARMWWMLKWCGLDNVAVLDGGLKAWLAAGHDVSTAPPLPSKATSLALQANEAMYVDAQAVLESVSSRRCILMDARATDRYRGENETIDKKAGHIPGAVSSPFMHNLDETGCFLTVETLRDYYQPLLPQSKACNVIVYCGSGVTAAHNILTMYHAGLGLAKLYPGSWSEWITDAKRPIALDE